MIFSQTLNTTQLKLGERSRTFIVASKAKDLASNLDWLMARHGNLLMTVIIGD